jgi:hypothetical protein
MASCTSIKRNGERCSAPARRGESFCFSHAPELAEQRKAGSARGGRNHATAARVLKGLPPELAIVFTRLLGWLDAVETDELTPRAAEVLGSLAGRLLEYARFALEATQAQDLEQRLQALEQAAQTPHRRHA